MSYAELMIKTNDGSGYEDGDILMAIPVLRRRNIWAESICHVKHAGFNSDGLRSPGTIQQTYQHETYQYLFRRVNNTTLERIELATGDIQIFGKESIDIELFLSRRVNHPQHRIFGASGREFWYGGKTSIEHNIMDHVWNDIETKTPLREMDHQLIPLGEMTGRTKVMIRVNDMTDEEAQELVNPIFDMTLEEEQEIKNNFQMLSASSAIQPKEKEVIRKRKYKVDWKSNLSFSPPSRDDILDRNKYIDKRIASEFNWSNVVEEK